jgi:hypothetical protein
MSDAKEIVTHSSVLDVLRMDSNYELEINLRNFIVISELSSRLCTEIERNDGNHTFSTQLHNLNLYIDCLFIDDASTKRIIKKN